MKWAATIAGAGACVGMFAVLAGGATGAVRMAYQVTAASLSQQGPQLVWAATLDHPFSPSSLKREHRSLCLFVRQRRGNLGAATACLEPGHRPGHPELVLSGSKPRVVRTSISRRGTRSVSLTFTPAALGLAYKAVRWQVSSTLRSSACTSDSENCTATFPARPVIARLHTPKLIGCVPHGPSLVRSGPSTAHEVALTFDDGPWGQPPTSAFLKVLEREHAPATFFEIGRQITGYDPGGSYARRMLADGDMIGDHTWSHPDMARLPASQQREQLLQTAAAIKRESGGFTPCLWRPPYGDVSPELVSLARSLGFLTIMWDVDPRDWAMPGVDAIYGNVVSNAHNGAIVIQHFGGGPRYQTVAALPREIETLRREGYKLVTVSQLLGLRLIYK